MGPTHTQLKPEHPTAPSMDMVLFDLAFNEFRSEELERNNSNPDNPDSFVEFHGYLPNHTSDSQLYALMISGAKIDFMDEGTWAFIPKTSAVHHAIIAKYPSARWNA